MIGIEQVSNSIKRLFDTTLRKPASIIPGIIMLCSLAKRPGLSPLISFGRIIQGIEKQGIPTEPLPDGSPNLMNIMMKEIVSETYRAIKEDMNIQVCLAPGTINVVATGGNAGGPVTVTGPNINVVTGNALAQ
jgi:hypothetical protein